MATSTSVCSMNMLIRQRDSEDASCLQLAAHLDRSTVLPDDICADPETEAGSQWPVCREECFVDPRSHLGIHSLAGRGLQAMDGSGEVCEARLQRAAGREHLYGTQLLLIQQ
jgi:hypothetical protein